VSRNPVTILMPVRNGLEYLPTALSGIASCISPQDEVIIIDDHSTDDGKKIIQEWVASSNQYQLFTNPGDGLVDALNFGISKAQNEWIARFDVDDVYEPNRIDHQMTMMGKNVVAVFSDYDFFTSEDEKVGLIRSAVFPNETALSVISSQRLAHSSVIYSKSAVLAVGGYRKSDYPAEDLSLWIRLIEVGALVSYPSPLLHYRISPNSITSLKKSEMNNQKNRLIKDAHFLNQVARNQSLGICQMYSKYRKYEDARERRILHLRDLLIASRYKFIKKPRLMVVLVLLLIEMINPKFWSIAIRLYGEKKKRQTARLS
jgi:glycosyltransferase involved in cell wall biosynthesis